MVDTLNKGGVIREKYMRNVIEIAKGLMKLNKNGGRGHGNSDNSNENLLL